MINRMKRHIPDLKAIGAGLITAYLIIDFSSSPDYEPFPLHVYGSALFIAGYLKDCITYLRGINERSNSLERKSKPSELEQRVGGWSFFL